MSNTYFFLLTKRIINIIGLNIHGKDLEDNIEKDLLLDVIDKFINYELNNQYENENLVLHEYKKPKYHISVQEFCNHCDNGVFIDFNLL